MKGREVFEQKKKNCKQLKERETSIFRAFILHHDSLILIKLIQFGEINTPFPFLLPMYQQRQKEQNMTIGKGCRKWKERERERAESSYEPYCQQYQPRKYRVDNTKCFFLTWTSESMNMGPHLIYINYIALWLRFPIRHDAYLLFFLIF